MKLILPQNDVEGPAFCSPQRSQRKEGLELWLGHMLVWQHVVSWNYHVFNYFTVLTFRNIFNSGHEGLPWRSWDWILWYHPPLGWPPTASPQSNPSSPLQVSESLITKTIKNIVCVKLSAVQSGGQLAFLEDRKELCIQIKYKMQLCSISVISL